MTQSNPDFEMPEMPIPPQPPPEDDFPCCSQHAPSCCKSGSNDLLTASEVKVLTETATRLGVALGRKEAAEEFDQLGATLMEFANNDRTRMRQATDLSMRAVYKNRADGYGDSAEAILRVSRGLSSQPAGATADATSGVPGHPEVSESRRAVRKRYPHAHACVTCSHDGRQPGPGCINCRHTGWDQTPCQAEGHKPQCPHDCCDPNAQEGAPAWDEPCEHPDCPCATMPAFRHPSCPRNTSDALDPGDPS